MNAPRIADAHSAQAMNRVPPSASGLSRRPSKRTRTWRQSERRVAAFVAVPALLPFVVFSLIPIGYIVYLSFTRYNGFLSPTWVGLDNYRLLIDDGTWWDAVLNTFVLAVGKVIIDVPLALVLAVFLHRGLRGASWFRTIYFVPHVISIAVMGVVFYFLFRPVDGIINDLLLALGLIGVDIDWLGSGDTAMLSLILVAVWAGFGINTVFFLVGMQTISREIYESASLDGANGWQQFRSITLPLLSPILRVVVMLTIVFSMRSFDLIKTLTDGGPAGQTQVMFTYLFDYFYGLNRGVQYGYASALAVVSSLIIAVVSLAYLYVSRQRDQGPRAGGRGA